MPYISNSPELLIGSLKHLLGSEFDDNSNYFCINNAYTNGTVRYRKVEQGFWVVALEIEFKVNIHSIALPGETTENYHLLAYASYFNQQQSIEVNNDAFPTDSWFLYRPVEPLNAYHFKGLKGLL